MLKTLAAWLGGPAALERIEQLEQRILVVIADAWYRKQVTQRSDVRQTRLLLSGSECITVSGTDAEIAAAASRLSRQTKNCVTVAVVVAYHHRRGCSYRRTAGVDAVGN